MPLAADLTIQYYTPETVPAALRVDRTPWGPPIRYTYVYAPKATPGDDPLLLIVETRSHGGMCPHECIGARIPSHHQDYARRWAPEGPDGVLWFEEDCAWSAIALAAPELFDDDTVELATAIAQKWLPKETSRG